MKIREKWFQIWILIDSLTLIKSSREESLFPKTIQTKNGGHKIKKKQKPVSEIHIFYWEHERDIENPESE